MNEYLYLLRDIGLLKEVPNRSVPTPKKVLARTVCFLHEDADNPMGFILFSDGFACMTKGCHTEELFGNNLIGLIRHLVYRVTGKVMGSNEARKYIKRNKETFKEFVTRNRVHSGSKPHPEVQWTLDELLACLQIPDPYFLSRGFKPETLVHFGVGRCVRPLPDGRSTLIGWPIIPIRRIASTLPPLGYQARNPRYGDGHEKVKYYDGFQKTNAVFTDWDLRRNSRSSHLIIAEGVPTALRLWEAGFNAVATFGASMSFEQRMDIEWMLYRSEKREQVFFAIDADETGRQFVQRQECRDFANCLLKPLRIIEPPDGRKDFGDCSVEEIQSLFASLGVQPHVDQAQSTVAPPGPQRSILDKLRSL